MADFTAEDVQALRRATGAGMMDAKRALQSAEGDAAVAARWLREKGLSTVADLAARENEDGAVAIAEAGTTAALVELRCETDFAAKAADFTALAQELAELVLAEGEDAVGQRSDDLDQLRVSSRENVEIGRVVRWEAADGNVLDTYLHRQDGRGKVGVLVELEGADREQAHQVALHVAFAKPRYLTRDEVPDEEVVAERATLEELTRKEGKPEQAVPKIVEGKLTAWFKERVLVEQDLFGEKKNAVADALGGSRIVRFAMASVGV